MTPADFRDIVRVCEDIAILVESAVVFTVGAMAVGFLLRHSIAAVAEWCRRWFGMMA